MIYCVLIINNSGQSRLAKFYTPLDVPAQQDLIKQVYDILLQRTVSQCNFLTPPALLQGEEANHVRIIYRQYATLNFVFIVDEQESELGILDLIHVFVESLDRCFENVCELDLVFGWEVLETVVEEIIQGGMVLETSVANIVAAVDEANSQTSTSGLTATTSSSSGPGGEAVAAASRALSNATSMLKSLLPT